MPAFVFITPAKMRELTRRGFFQATMQACPITSSRSPAIQRRVRAQFLRHVASDWLPAIGLAVIGLAVMGQS